MTAQMLATQLLVQIIASMLALIVVTCILYPTIKRKTDNVVLWTIFCLVPFLNGLAYLLILSKTDKDVLARLKALEDAQRRP